jgi:RimJ/RimL family protein N-acetyltransferase
VDKIGENIVIHLIEEKNYNKVKNLIGDFSHGIFPSCVCNGNNPGWIYANDPENPTSAFVYMKNLGGTLVGDCNNDEFNRSFKNNLEIKIIPKIKECDDDFYCVTGSETDSGWDKSIESILKEIKYDCCSVLRYKFIEIPKSSPTLSGDIEIREITPELLKSNSIVNISALINDILTWWGTLDRFLEIGCGFIAVKNNELCGWSYSVCIVDSKVEIYIETVEKYRNNGIGTAIANRFVQYCIEHDLKPEWEAMSDIKASLRIAEKVGFEFDYEYKMYEFDFETSEN